MVEVRLRRLREGILGCVGGWLASGIAVLIYDVLFGLLGRLQAGQRGADTDITLSQIMLCGTSVYGLARSSAAVP
jgi:hypothetical protein